MSAHMRIACECGITDVGHDKKFFISEQAEARRDVASSSEEVGVGTA